MCAGLLPVTRLFSYTCYKYQLYQLSYLIIVHGPDVMSLILCSIKCNLIRKIYLFNVSFSTVAVNWKVRLKLYFSSLF